MLNSEIIKKIEEFVYAKPRSIQEIALHIGKNWRTADRYIDEISKERGSLSCRTFRGGTRGALKIVYWASIEKASHSIFQEILESSILNARKKEDFSVFDIFQHVPDKNKKAVFEKNKKYEARHMEEYADLIAGASKQVLIFSGNLSFISSVYGEEIIKALEKAISNKVSIKVLCRVDAAAKKNVEKLLSLNFKHGKEAIEIKHSYQPLRGAIIDSSTMRFKDVFLPTGKTNELKDEISCVYLMKDKDWSEWLSNIFWKIFSSSVSASKRISELNKIRQ